MQAHRNLLTPRRLAASAVVSGLAAASGAALAQSAVNPWSGSRAAAWQQCTAVVEGAQRLACFDQWAQQQAAASVPPAPAALTMTASNSSPAPTAMPESVAPDSNGGCRDQRYSVISRFFELEPATDCGTFTFRGYRPLSVSVTAADRMNRQPSSPSQAPAAYRDYDKQELRLQLSARTKVASGLLTDSSQGRKDSVWVAYAQQSHWQVFNSRLSRPFRNTDHEPEVFYVYPTDFQLPGGWRWRYSGVGLVHHSNGQSEPLSRSWNRWYVMTGAELGQRWQLHAKVWKRISEKSSDDDNPRLQDYWGRGEIKLGWQINDVHTVGFALRGTPGKGKGAGQLEWLRTLGEGRGGNKSNLRLHVQVFSGYGESLIDYNVKRTSLSVGLSLLDF